MDREAIMKNLLETRRSLYVACLSALLALPGASTLAEESEAKPINYGPQGTTFVSERYVVPPRVNYKTRSIAVAYDDLNMQRRAGAKTLHRRLTTASHKVCGSPDWQDRIMRKDWRACVASSLDSAVANVNLDTLNAYHLAETGRNVAPGEMVAQSR